MLPRDVAVEAAFDRVSQCIAEIRDGSLAPACSGSTACSPACRAWSATFRADLGKHVRLQADGGDVEMDREMIEMIRDPLTHIVRNAIDHGIEAPEAREAAGKPMHGTLKVSARQAGNQIIIEVADDGRGIDGEALVRKARSLGLAHRRAG